MQPKEIFICGRGEQLAFFAVENRWKCYELNSLQRNKRFFHFVVRFAKMKRIEGYTDSSRTDE